MISELRRSKGSFMLLLLDHDDVYCLFVVSAACYCLLKYTFPIGNLVASF